MAQRVRTWALAGLLAAAMVAPGAAGGSGPPPSPAQPQPVVVKVDSGFDWLDAALGAAAALAAVLVAVGLAGVVRTDAFHNERSKR
jgi:hypothetical protein